MRTSKPKREPKPIRKLIAGVDYIPLPPLGTPMSKEELADMFEGAAGAGAELLKMIQRDDARKKDGAA